jgi:glycosyltransferase 2 family protein
MRRRRHDWLSRERVDLTVQRWQPALAAIVTWLGRGASLLHSRWAMPLRVVLTVAMLGVVLSRGDVLYLPSEIGRVNVPLLATMLACSYAAWGVNTYRWQRILAAYDVRRHLGELFRLNLAGVFYSLALPGQVSGEVLKAWRLAGRSEQRRTVFVSVFLDRVTGMIGLGGLGSLALLLDPPSVEWMGLIPCLLVLVAATVSGVVVMTLPALPSLVIGPTTIWSPGLARVGGLVLRLTTVDSQAPKAKALATICALGFASQAIMATIHWGVALAVGINLSPFALTWILAITVIIGMLPVSLAGLGVRELTYVALLSLFGVSTASALTLSLATFAILVVLGLTGGAIDLVARDARAPSGSAG